MFQQFGVSRQGEVTVKLNIPNKTMRQKLERLLSGIPGNFSYHPRLISGLDQLVVFRDNGISCPQFTVDLEDAKKWVQAGHQVFWQK